MIANAKLLYFIRFPARLLSSLGLADPTWIDACNLCHYAAIIDGFAKSAGFEEEHFSQPRFALRFNRDLKTI